MDPDNFFSRKFQRHSIQETKKPLCTKFQPLAISRCLLPLKGKTSRYTKSAHEKSFKKSWFVPIALKIFVVARRVKGKLLSYGFCDPIVLKHLKKFETLFFYEQKMKNRQNKCEKMFFSEISMRHRKSHQKIRKYKFFQILISIISMG